MPTSLDEMDRAMAIVQEYLTPAEAAELFTRLDEDVGQPSLNDSVKQSFAGFRHLADLALVADLADDRHTQLVIRWFIIWFCHTLLITINFAAALVAPFLAPWYLAGPLVFTVIWVIFSGAECPITSWENAIRVQLGWPMVRGFLGHYFLRPCRRIYRRRRAVRLDSASQAR